jgi:hypothetical protein
MTISGPLYTYYRHGHHVRAEESDVESGRRNPSPTTSLTEPQLPLHGPNRSGWICQTGQKKHSPHISGAAKSPGVVRSAKAKHVRSAWEATESNRLSQWFVSWSFARLNSDARVIARTGYRVLYQSSFSATWSCSHHPVCWSAKATTTDAAAAATEATNFLLPHGLFEISPCTSPRSRAVACTASIYRLQCTRPCGAELVHVCCMR